MGKFFVGSGIHFGLWSSFGGDSLSSLRGGVSKFVLGLGPVVVHDRNLGLGGWGEALLPSWGRLGDALPPDK